MRNEHESHFPCERSHGKWGFLFLFLDVLHRTLSSGIEAYNIKNYSFERWAEWKLVRGVLEGPVRKVLSEMRKSRLTIFQDWNIFI
jgi:hypothetical protein